MPGRDPSGRFLPRNPPQRSAERQHLRRADRAPRYQLLAHAARLSDARERLNLRELKASRAQAAAALRNAEEQAPQQLVDRLLGAVAADVLTVADATARLAEEETAYDEATAARVLLDDELEEIRLQLGVLRLRCDNALSAVLQTDPRVEMLWQRHHEARQVVRSRPLLACRRPCRGHRAGRSRLCRFSRISRSREFGGVEAGGRETRGRCRCFVAGFRRGRAKRRGGNVSRPRLAAQS